MKKHGFNKIVIIGLGLMGGSLAASVRQKFPKARVVGVARRKSTIQTACKKKWIHEGSHNLSPSLQGADLVVICLPVDLINKTLSEIDRLATSSICVTDVGSVKRPVESFVKKRKWKHVQFVGAHPMVGSHEKGINAAKKNLYSDGLTIITPSVHKSAQKKVISFWKRICSKVILLNAREHDRRVALISHLPHLVSVGLANTVDNKAMSISSSGFSDMTRLAQGDKAIWSPIFLQNKGEIILAITSFENNLKQFRSFLVKNDKSSLNHFLEKGLKRASKAR